MAVARSPFLGMRVPYDGNTTAGRGPPPGLINCTLGTSPPSSNLSPTLLPTSPLSSNFSTVSSSSSSPFSSSSRSLDDVSTIESGSIECIVWPGKVALVEASAKRRSRVNALVASGEGRRSKEKSGTARDGRFARDLRRRRGGRRGRGGFEKPLSMLP